MEPYPDEALGVPDGLAGPEARVALLTADATWSMPPIPTWYAGDALVGFLAEHGMSAGWRHVPTRASGHLAAGC